MLNEGLPPEAVRFIGAHIRSISQLEILLLLRESGESLSITQINERLRSSPAFVEREVAALISAGLAASAEGTIPLCYRYSPASDTLANSVAQLAGLYADYRVRVIAAIYSRIDPMQTFAEAFRIRKDPESNG